MGRRRDVGDGVGRFGQRLNTRLALEYRWTKKLSAVVRAWASFPRVRSTFFRTPAGFGGEREFSILDGADLETSAVLIGFREAG